MNIEVRLNYVFDVTAKELKSLLSALHESNKKAAFEVKASKQIAIGHLIQKLESARGYDPHALAAAVKGDE